MGASIVPPTKAKSSLSEDVNDYVDKHTEKINFNVAITVTEEVEGKSGIGVFIAGFGIGGQEKTDTSNVSVSTISFSVPVLLPRQT